MARQELVDVELRNFISNANVEDWRKIWVPEHFRLIGRILDRGDDIMEHVESAKWNWGKKVYELRVSDNQIGFSLVSQGVTQAMMIIDISKKCKHWLQSNQNLVYIEYIQSAPWNNRQLNDGNVRYGGTGTILMRKAVEFSRNSLWRGRLGLHSLRNSEGFYRKAGMKELGADANYQGLSYFEMTPHQADIFMDKDY